MRIGNRSHKYEAVVPNSTPRNSDVSKPWFMYMSLPLRLRLQLEVQVLQFFQSGYYLHNGIQKLKDGILTHIIYFY